MLRRQQVVPENVLTPQELCKQLQARLSHERYLRLVVY